MNRPTPAHHRGMPPPQLARYGSAPGSFLAALADSVARGGGGGGGGGEVPFHSPSQQHQPVGAVVSRFFSGESSGLTSCESSCRTDAPAALQRAYGGSGEIHVPPPALPQQQPGLLRHSSSPAGLLSRLMADPHGNGGMGDTRGGMGSGYAHSHSQGGAGGNADAMAAQQRRLSSQWSFSRQQDMMPHIAEMGMAMPTPMPPAADVGESIATGHGGSSDLSRSFSMSSWDDTNSNIMFSAPGGKKAKVMADGDDGMVTSFSNIDSQFGSSLDMPGMDDYLQLQQDSVACRVRAKRGCATHPRSIAERERRTRISKRLRRLQDLVPNMDKVTKSVELFYCCQ